MFTMFVFSRIKRSVAGCVIIINFQNTLRCRLRLQQWSTPDYAVKIVGYFLCGISTMTTQLPIWSPYSQEIIISVLALQSVDFGRHKTQVEVLNRLDKVGDQSEVCLDAIC
jgi:hypothetical protein